MYGPAAWAEISGRFGVDPVAIEAARLSLANAVLSVASEDSRDAKALKKAALQKNWLGTNVSGTRARARPPGQPERPTGLRRRRKVVEEPFGYCKNIGGLARPKFKGVAFTSTMAAYDLVRLPKLLGALAA